MPTLLSLMPDPVREKEGVWRTYAPGVRARIARMNNPAFVEAHRRAFGPHRSRLRRGEMPPDELSRLLIRLHAEHILLDWEGIDDEATLKPQPYSVEKAFEYLSDPRCEHFYSWVLETAGEVELYRSEQREESLGNSARSSNGASPSGTEPTS